MCLQACAEAEPAPWLLCDLLRRHKHVGATQGTNICRFACRVLPRSEDADCRHNCGACPALPVPGISVSSAYGCCCLLTAAAHPHVGGVVTHERQQGLCLTLMSALLCAPGLEITRRSTRQVTVQHLAAAEYAATGISDQDGHCLPSTATHVYSCLLQGMRQQRQPHITASASCFTCHAHSLGDEQYVGARELGSPPQQGRGLHHVAPQTPGAQHPQPGTRC
jgi:hypothetical protein